MAFTGPIPIILGSTPTTAELTILAIGFKLYFFTASSEAISVAAAPSFNPEALPAVTLPPSFLKAERNFASISFEEFLLEQFLWPTDHFFEQQQLSFGYCRQRHLDLL